MEFPSSVKEWRKLILPVLLGGALGYAYYYFIGCVSGTCPITSNPWVSTIYGAVMGLLLSQSFTKKQPQQEGSQNRKEQES
ncbi:MAG: hypothetical protein EPO24_14320 [Bacteroidetes bacterium]|nr:MAG: hypothetical protein EPO24_14320 [Bacteroidota bacterium]